MNIHECARCGGTLAAIEGGALAWPDAVRRVEDGLWCPPCAATLPPVPPGRVTMPLPPAPTIHDEVPPWVR